MNEENGQGREERKTPGQRESGVVKKGFEELFPERREKRPLGPRQSGDARREFEKKYDTGD